jgi:hypothetical protein
MLRLLCFYEEETRVSIMLSCLIKSQETFFMRSVKGVISSTRCCG